MQTGVNSSVCKLGKMCWSKEKAGKYSIPTIRQWLIDVSVIGLTEGRRKYLKLNCFEETRQRKAEHWTALYFQHLFGIICAAIGSSYIWMEWIISSLTRAYLVNTLLRTLSSVSSFSLVCHLFSPVCPFIYRESSFSFPVSSFFPECPLFLFQCSPFLQCVLFFFSSVVFFSIVFFMKLNNSLQSQLELRWRPYISLKTGKPWMCFSFSLFA